MNSAAYSSAWNDDAFLQRALRWHDGALDADELAALEQEMLASEEKRRVFAELQMRSMLLNEVLRREAYALPEPAAGRSPRRITFRRFLWPLAAGIAITFLIAGLWNHRDKPGAGAGLAAVTYDEVAEWEDGQGPDDGQFSEGQYALASGTVRLSLAHDGTVATVAGPARFDLVAPGHIRLHEGRLSAQVSNPDAGFTVFTDALTVLDRGTVFGVDVRSDGEAMVSVLEGMVDVHPPGTREMQRIEQGGRFLAHPKRKAALEPGADVVIGFEDLWPLTMGVDDLSHLVQFIVPRAKHRWNDYRSDTRLFLMPERQRVKADGALMVDIAPGAPLDKKKPGRAARSLPAGRKLSSYLLFFRPLDFRALENPAGNPGGNMPDISGSITFAHPVLGIIADSARLDATDDTLGHPRITYRDKPRRGIERSRKPGGRDVVRISRDRRRVYFNLHATSDPDEFRVLVAAP